MMVKVVMVSFGKYTFVWCAALELDNRGVDVGGHVRSIVCVAQRSAHPSLFVYPTIKG